MKSRKRLIRLTAMFLAALILVTGTGVMTAKADTPYRTFTKTEDADGDNVQETQAAYLPYKTLVKFGDEFLNGPSDMYVAEDGKIYIADTGNGRIVVGDINSNLVTVIGEGTLVAPKGVFVTEENGHIYVADRDAEAVFEFDAEGNVLNKYTKPNSPLYGDALSFLPLKIVVNDAGVMYVICESNTNGIVEISPNEDGSFLGYFGTNFSDADWWTVFRRAISTDEQRAKMVSNIPSTPDNLSIDEKGLIYTVTRGDGDRSLKRLNIAGLNLLGEQWNDETPAAVATGNHDNIFVVSQQGYIYEYNKDGDFLYVFGALDDGSQRVGLSTLASSIQVDTSDRIYILDADKCQIQIYEPTEFTDLLHEALYLYSKGRYTESKEPLTEVLKMNSMFQYANRAMGRAYFQEENYEKAQYYAKLSNDYTGYSDAFWEVRNQWLKNNLVPAVFIILGIWLAMKLIKYFDKKKGILAKPKAFWEEKKNTTVISNLRYSKYYMKHPMDGSYGIAREGRASWIAPSILLVIFTLEFVIDKYLCGFLQKTIGQGRFEIVTDVGMIAIVIFAVTVCNYLVCTINEGEGSIKKIYTYFCYSLMPYILLTPITFVLSHVLTKNEQFLITMVQLLAIGWIVVLVVLAIKEVNNFTSSETLKIICLTIFTILILALLIFVIYILWAQVFEFISAVVGEVVYRLGY